MPASVLIVEDEWLIADDYACLLREAGHAVVGPCATVREAISLVEDTAIEAALLDIELRGEKSFPVAERLLARNIPFAFLSGHASDDLPPHMQGQRMLAKPVESAALLATVEKMCRSN